ncbi:MAG TPA: FAD-dependent oxidoreductase [Acholeplasmataceae bacterium]|nr:FAD-dependent oxidoreductase [Acholeplasmataceae bacterium]
MFEFNFDTQPKNTFDTNEVYDFLVIGGGPAGLNASLYAYRLGMKTGIVTYDIGGQLKNTNDVDNYMGLPNDSGGGLTQKFINHIQQFQIPILEDVYVTKVEKLDELFHVYLDNSHIVKAKTVLLATGSVPKKLGIPGEQMLNAKGISYCAICDAPFFKDKHVVVAGGGNSAVESALDLAKWAKKVTVIQRSNFRADKILLEQMYANDKIEYMIQTKIIEIHGKTQVEGLTILDNKTNQTSYFKADGLFVAIGMLPNTAYVNDLVELNVYNEVLVNHQQETSVKGLYAAGDMVDQPHKQIIIAAAEGAKAALNANQYLKYKGE